VLEGHHPVPAAREFCRELHHERGLADVLAADHRE
jgi:hypothetical protein